MRVVVRGLLVVGLCVAMVGLLASTPVGVDKGAPIVRSGQLGEPVRGDDIEVRVARVSVGTEVTAPGTATPSRAVDAVFVVVTATVTAVRQNAYLQAALYAPDGSQSDPLLTVGDRAPTLDKAKELQPGIPLTGAVVFQVAPELAVGASVAMQLDVTSPLVEQVRVELRIDDAQVRKAERAAPIRIPTVRAG